MDRIPPLPTVYVLDTTKSIYFVGKMSLFEVAREINTEASLDKC